MKVSQAVSVDGTIGEGGGQVLRHALTLSMVTGRAIEVTDICANRPEPGLMRRHLTTVRAAAEICGADLDGAQLGSQRLYFAPGEVKAGDYSFGLGTGKSAVKLLQTLLPPLLVAEGPSTLRVQGSTHAPDSPPLESLAKTWAPLVGQMGPAVEVRGERYGFAPAGGGRVVVGVEPAAELTPLRLLERGEVQSKRATALVAHLGEKIGDRELETLQGMMNWGEDELEVVVLDGPAGPGNALLVELVSQHITEVFAGVGTRSLRAEVVAQNAARMARDYLAAEVPVSRHTADQLIIPMAMAGSGTFCTTALSRHTLSAIELVGQLTDLEVAVANIRGQWHVEI